MPSSVDFFEDSLLSLFDHHPVAFSTSSPSEPYIYLPPSLSQETIFTPSTSGSSSSSTLHDVNRSPIPLTLPVAPSALHQTLQLTHIWLSSLLLSDLIFLGLVPVRDLRVAELGAGAGLPSGAAVRCGAKGVVASDYEVPVGGKEQDEGGEGGEVDLEDVLGVLRGNVARASEGTCKEEGKDWSVVGHTWGTSVSSLLRGPHPSLNRNRTRPLHTPPAIEDVEEQKFDTLLLADLLWSSSSHTTLIQSCRALLRPPTPPSTPTPTSSNEPSTYTPPPLPCASPSSTPKPCTPSHTRRRPSDYSGGTAHVIAGLHQGRGALHRFQAEWQRLGGWIEEREEVRWGRDGRWERYERPGGEGGGGGGEEERGVVVWFEAGL